MKKAFSVFAALILIFAAGCENQTVSETKTPPPIPENFSANLRIAYNETSMTAAFRQNSFDDFELNMLSPEILKPLSLAYKNDICTVTYDGLKFETDLNRFPQVTFGALLTEAISYIKQGIDIQTAYADGIWTYKGNGERGIFVLTRDAETGAWLELSIEGAGLHIMFSEFKQE
ncbi:MAG: hypothetical protein IJE74_03895 [Clostridia bacterium]|nr:hypothetical protein [Clostridia bacterium]